ncbi:unnamed protein product [Somion occarium]|uniref:Protein-S-isoprenylcysteine O-methyltransferase n=1 Tax=Somion occarium TaxID=3059160 RepID=A0ABP1DXX9_9APHY
MSLTPSLVKLPLLLTNALLCRRAVQPPNPPSAAEERQKYEENKKTRDFLDRITPWYLPALPIAFHVMSAIEAYVILSTALPFLQAPFIYRLLVPGDSTDLLPRIHVTPSFTFGSLLIFAGTMLRLACYSKMGPQFTFDLSIRKEHKLVTDGPYSIVRHPSYLGTFLYSVGLLLAQFGSGSWWQECGIWDYPLGKVMGLIRIAFQNEFKEQWVAWTKKTPYKLFPGIY